MIRILEGALLRELRDSALGSPDRERVGLILPSEEVVLLSNVAAKPQRSFSVHFSEVKEAIKQAGYGFNETILKQTTFWHTHPGGGVGPSRTDMQNKVPHMSHLVLTLSGDDIVPAWY